MGPEGEQAVLEEDPPAPLPPCPLPLDCLGLHPLPVYLSRSTQTREVGVMGRTLNGIAGTTALILLLAGCRPESDSYRTFADFPGFAAYYAGRCLAPSTLRTEIPIRYGNERGKPR